MECKNEFIDLSLAEQKTRSTLPFCRQESLMCQKVSDFIVSPEEFCHLMGFKMAKEYEPSNKKPQSEIDVDEQVVIETENNCFDGYPSVGRRYPKLKRSV